VNALPKLLYDNALAGAGGTLAAGSTDAGTQYNVANLIDGRTHTLWKGANASDNFVQITGLSPTLAIDSIGIVGHNLGTIGADVDVQQWNGSSWIAIAGAGPWSPTSDKPFFRTWSSSPLRTGFRINLTSMSAAPQIAVLIIGTHFTFEWWLQAGWDPTA